jgi:hypothetical protein
MLPCDAARLVAEVRRLQEQIDDLKDRLMESAYGEDI